MTKSSDDERQPGFWHDAEFSELNPRELANTASASSTPPEPVAPMAVPKNFREARDGAGEEAWVFKKATALILGLSTKEIADRDLEAISLEDPDLLDSELRKRLSGLQGPERKKLQQPISKLRSELVRQGVKMRDGHRRRQPSEDWSRFLSSKPKDVRRAAYPIACWATEQGIISPSEFMNENFGEYCYWLKGQHPQNSARSAASATRRALETGVDEYPNLGNLEIPWVKKQRVRKAGFPPELDCELDQVYSPEVTAALGSQTTIANNKSTARQLILAYYRLFGSYPANLRRLTDPEVASTLLDERAQRTGNSAYAHDTAGFLADLSHRLDRADWQATTSVEELQDAFGYGDPRLTDDELTLLANFAVYEKAHALFTTPTRKYLDLRAGERLGTDRLIELQGYCLWHLLPLAPVWPGLLATATIGADGSYTEHKTPVQNVTMKFPAKAGRNPRTLEYGFEGRHLFVPITFLRLVRPLLACEGSTFLFHDHNGRPITSQAISKTLADLTKRDLGVELTATRFRLLSAFIHLILYPEDVGLVRAKLGAMQSSRFKYLDELVQTWRLGGLFESWSRYLNGAR